MSAANRAKELKEKFVGLGAPPARDEIKGALRIAATITATISESLA